MHGLLTEDSWRVRTSYVKNEALHFAFSLIQFTITGPIKRIKVSLDFQSTIREPDKT